MPRIQPEIRKDKHIPPAVEEKIRQEREKKNKEKRGAEVIATWHDDEDDNESDDGIVKIDMNEQKN